MEDTSTLIIRNSKFTTIPSRDSLLGCTSIILVNQSNFIITNATVIFIHPIYPGDVECEIYVQDNAKANITYSTVQTGQVVGLGNSVIHVKNSTLTTTTSWDKFSGVATSDNSTAEIEKSTMDVAFVGANSTVSIKNSVIGWINIEAENSPDKSTINIATSKIGQISAWEATKIYVEDSTVKWLNAWSDADILLVDCHVKNFQIHGDPKLLVGWNLPLFGLVKMPYTWIPYVQLTVAILICVIIVIALGVLLRKRARKKPDSNEKIKIKIKPPY